MFLVCCCCRVLSCGGGASVCVVVSFVFDVYALCCMACYLLLVVRCVLSLVCSLRNVCGSSLVLSCWLLAWCCVLSLFVDGCSLLVACRSLCMGVVVFLFSSSSLYIYIYVCVRCVLCVVRGVSLVHCCLCVVVCCLLCACCLTFCLAVFLFLFLVVVVCVLLLHVCCMPFEVCVCVVLVLPFAVNCLLICFVVCW